MNGPEVLDVARDAILTLVLVASPLMLIGLAVRVVISLLQALTQIQEMTLVFVPKILAIFVAMMIALPFMADLLHGHMLRIAARIAGGGHELRRPGEVGRQRVDARLRRAMAAAERGPIRRVLSRAHGGMGPCFRRDDSWRGFD